MNYFDNEYYHVYNRGENKNTLFFSDDNYSYCQRLLQKCSTQYHVSLLCYCLMPNHFHLLLRQNIGGSISKFVQTTFNAYTQALNREKGRSGTLFEGRAKGIHIETERYLVNVSRYIHLNPVIAGLVNNPEEWEFSDYRNWIYSPMSVSSRVDLRDMFFRDGTECQAFIKEYQQEKEQEFLGKYMIYDD